MKILLAEDDVALADALLHCLRDAGHDVALVRDGAAALRELADATPDLLVLDHGLPRVHGSQVLRQVRAAARQPLVLLCSALDDAPQRLAEQGLAADDFLAKPFGLGEFESCVARLLQRLFVRGRGRSIYGPLSCDASSGEILVDGAAWDLPGEERALLILLVRAAGRPVSPEQLAEQLDAHDGTRALRRVDAGVASLRERLAVHALGITRLRGLGFCLAPIGWAP